ncbi:hypothetical protein [Streptomyces rubiginosohelvolus]|uniref:Uncharacterized protein n=1 Tax=Streptomyces rubiginosohelvolus TaxID=67362 RepID=A0ABQ3CA07_9ACTN|nr:hypothetical protein [Streptomyces pluricolorescens]GGZ78870.1 hypothetical protein GCM10010328_62140 [Streptomyces pluricolorescens]
MKSIVAGRVAASTTEFIELALGTPLDLWLGLEGESEMERAARLDAARDILADNPDFPDRVSQVAAQAIEAHAPELFNVTLLSARRPAGRRQYRGGVAA